MTCRACDGTGRLPLNLAFAGICSRCHGTGTEAPERENGGAQ